MQHQIPANRQSKHKPYLFLIDAVFILGDITDLLSNRLLNVNDIMKAEEKMLGVKHKNQPFTVSINPYQS